MKSADKKLIKFFELTHFDNLPKAVIHQTKRALLDTLGCILAGLSTPLGKSVLELSRQFPFSDGATVPSIDHGVVPNMGAMANGFLANALDADDGHRMSRVHNGGILFPAIFAEAQLRSSSGRDVMTAAVIGYEIGLRAGMALNNSGEIYYGSAHGGTYSAAAATGYLMGLTPEEIINALGIVEIQAPSCHLMGWVNARKIPMIKEGMGWAAATGYTAALMAGHGITGTLTLYDTFAREACIDDLGSDFQILKTYFKPFAACRWTQGPIENLSKILKAHPLDPDDIVKIQVRTPDKAANLDTIYPQTPEDAQYSIPFALGALLAYGKVGPAEMGVDRLKDPEILKCAEKVEVVADPDMQALYPRYVATEVAVTTHGRTTYTEHNKKISGDWDRPMTDQELIDKFIEYAGPVLGPQQADNLCNQIMALEQVADINDILMPLASIQLD
jgi:2-methylcitrate dehydratase PrpD